MFIRPSKWATRCLRCQYGFISQGPQSPKLRAPRFIENTQRLFSTRVDAPEKDNEHRQTDAADDSPQTSVPITYVAEPEIGETTQLGLDTLGERGEVFVLGEGEICGQGRGRARPETSFLNNTAKRRLSDLSLLKQLEAEKSELSDSSYAKHNLERLRSTRQTHDALLKKEWLTLRAAIMDGFTLPQLSNYISDFGSAPMETDQPIWFPDKSSNLSGKHSPDPSTGKRYLAEKVMRVCWKLEIEGETGQLYLHLRPQDISMLLNAKRGPLKDISETYGVKIDVSRSQNLVSITGDRYSCESVRESIRNFTSRVCSATLTSSYSRIFCGDDRRFDEEFLDFLRSEYGVSCEKKVRGKNISEINMAYLSENDQDAQEMRRSLGLGLISTRLPRTPFSVDANSGEEAFLSPVNAPDSLSWLDRRKQWFRWNKPAKRFGDPGSLSQSGKSAGLRQSTVEQDLRGRPRTRGSYLSTFDSLSQKMTATVGKCLFLSSPTLGTKWISADGLTKMASHRTFIDDIPNPGSFLSGLHEDSSRTSHKVRLTPSPFNTFVVPPIELELDIPESDPTQKPTLRRVSAIVHKEDTDLLLPHNTLDVRFTRSLHYDLLPEGFPTSQHENNPILESILKSVESLRYRLPLIQTQPSVPPFCRLVLPKELLEVEMKNASHKKPTPANEMVEMEYMFPPVKSILGFRQGVFSYEGCDLNFIHSFNGPMLANQTRSTSLVMQGKPEPNVMDFRAFGSIVDHARSLAFELGHLGEDGTI